MDDAQCAGCTRAHQTYGEGAAILAALALINRAYASVGTVAEPPEKVQSAGSTTWSGISVSRAF